MVSDDLVGDGETQAGPLSGGLGRKEGVEDALDGVARNSATLVLDGHDDPSRLGRRTDANRTLPVDGLEGVDEEVEEDLFELLGGATDFGDLLVAALDATPDRELRLCHPQHRLENRLQRDELVISAAGVGEVLDVAHDGDDAIHATQALVHQLAPLFELRAELVHQLLGQLRVHGVEDVSHGAQVGAHVGHRIVDLVGDPRGQLPHSGEAVGYDQATAQTRDLPQIACHQNDTDLILPPVVDPRRRHRHRHRVAVQRAQEALLLAHPFRKIDIAPLQQIQHGAALQGPGLRPEQPLHSRIGDADASVEAKQRDAIGEGRQDVGREGPGHHQRVAVAVEAPRDDTDQQRDGGRPEAGGDATRGGNHTVRPGRYQQRQPDARQQHICLPPLGRRSRGAEVANRNQEPRAQRARGQEVGRGKQRTESVAPTPIRLHDASGHP